MMIARVTLLSGDEASELATVLKNKGHSKHIKGKPSHMPYTNTSLPHEIFFGKIQRVTCKAIRTIKTK
jgi:hypothetical protein